VRASGPRHPPAQAPIPQHRYGPWKVPRLMETADQTGAACVAALRCRPPARRFHSRLETGSRPPSTPALHRPPSPLSTTSHRPGGGVIYCEKGTLGEAQADHLNQP
jgi:hypothetical protein